jgi:hypothetical protein
LLRPRERWLCTLILNLVEATVAKLASRAKYAIQHNPIYQPEGGGDGFE